ncbi:hypothetical protein CMV_001452 [Castanea mollissima]|uniref:Uncharacterized protein n=1 Tax=Castanea mollissima TaxID=60419 RepID=A0A8J4RKT7_9ROSI|nr:hypothetical protein CMV_001452 [Castanea mollissima]
MAPNRENPIGFYSKRPSSLSMESLQRTISDISFELSKEDIDIDIEKHDLPPISEVEEAKCECCEMSEECTREYINGVREKFSGKLICGLCAEAVSEEMEKNGGKREEALNEHISACVRFTRFGRTHPVLYQAEAFKEILKKSSRTRAKSASPTTDKGGQKKSKIARSSSCIPAITRDIAELNN